MHPLDEQVAAGIRGDFETGWKIAEFLRRTTPDDPRAQFNRAWYEMRRGRLLEGLRLLDAGRWVKAFGDKPLPTTKTIYRDQDLTDKHLLFCSEGGLGDEIINARFIPDFARRGAKVILTCDPGLMTVFSRLDGVAAVIGHRHASDVYHDYWIPGMSAPRVLEVENETLTGQPYLTAEQSYVDKWRTTIAAHFGPRDLRIGLRFFGNPKFEHEQHRRFPADGLVATLGSRPWVSLQREDSDLDLATWEDTLGVLASLDLVITSCTSVAHASAAMGKRTWIILPVMPYYLWALPGETSPWYRSVRLFRQTRYGQWSDVFARIANELEVENSCPLQS